MSRNVFAAPATKPMQPEHFPGSVYLYIWRSPQGKYTQGMGQTEHPIGKKSVGGHTLVGQYRTAADWTPHIR